jgi:phytoene dehydrogenase-like protein
VIRRREFLAAAAALAAGACTSWRSGAIPPGEMLATNHRAGHLLRDGGVPAPSEVRKVPIAIVGGGIGGLSAAWRLARAGVRDYEIFELEDAAGGNARWGRNDVSAYPWGAHYVPLPTRESRWTRELLADLGVLLGDPDAETPRYEERALCQAPQERLYRNGTWEPGLVPVAGRTASELDEWRRFDERMRAFKRARGRDGRPAFAIPLDHSSRDPALLALDGITMEAWLRSEGFVSEAVHWLANYACRDDYGCDYRVASAWAGIHYFACRTGTARHADDDTVLTWPEGNGFIVRKIVERIRPKITHGALVHSVTEARRGAKLGVYLARERRAIEVEAEQVIWAAPLAFAARAMPASDLAGMLRGYDYGAWVVANLTLSEPPYLHHGAPLCWDNTLFDAPSLGYVVATHQGVASRPGPTVLTWYLPLANEAPAEARKRLAATPRETWAAAALAELARPHPEIGSITQRIDVFANGHAMALPRPGRLWGEARQRILAQRRRVHFAHADASGLSLFEEANHQGVRAAENVLRA